ncbi:MAG: N-acetyltransferase, partial [Kofleriaceae bacterium]
VGANATIVCGVAIGAYAMIGAGAVVTRDVPAHGVMVGTPARRIGWACRCGETLAGAICARCGARYELTADAARLTADSGA